jgi:hypothetical protein
MIDAVQEKADPTAVNINGRAESSFTLENP